MRDTPAPSGARTDHAPGLPAPLLFWGAVASLVGVELLFLSIRFDVRLLLAVAGIKESTGENSILSTRMLALGGVAGALATLLFGAGRIAPELSRPGRPWGFPARAWKLLAAQSAAFAAFVGIASGVLETTGEGRTCPAPWSAAWAASGLATLGLAVAAVLPAARWWPLARAIPGAIAAGLAVGVATAASGLATAALWRPMAAGTLRVSAGLLGLFHPAVICRPELMELGTPGCVVRIAPACSGYEGIGLALVFLGGFLWFDRSSLRWPRATLLLPMGLALIWLCNAARIAALVSVGAWISPALAFDGFHSQAGSIGFTAVALGMVAIGRSRVFRLGPAGAEPGRARYNPAAPYLVPQLAILGSTMVAAAFTIHDGPDRAYPLRVLAAGLAFLWFGRSYRDLGRSWSWPAVGSGVAVFALWMALEPASSPSTGPLAGLSAPSAMAWLAFRVIGSVVAVPMAEELAFRGYIARRLESADFESVAPRRLGWAAIALSSIAFGALHGRWLAGSLAGLVYALTYRRRGALSDAVVAHALTNALIAAYVISTGRWSLWS